MRFDDLLTFQQRQAGKDALNQPLKNWEPVASIGNNGQVWGSVKAITGREFLSAQAGQAQVQYKIVTPFFEGVVPTMRIVYGSTIYNIEAVLPEGRKWLFLMCSTGLNNG